MTSIHSECDSSLVDWLLLQSYSMTVMPSTSLCMMTTVDSGLWQRYVFIVVVEEAIFSYATKIASALS
jgi:hypothetical protein